MSRDGAPWSLSGEVVANALPIVERPVEPIGVAVLRLWAVQWPGGRRHLVPGYDEYAYARTLCGLARGTLATEPVLVTSPEPVTDCARCGRSGVLTYWRDQNPQPPRP